MRVLCGWWIASALLVGGCGLQAQLFPPRAESTPEQKACAAKAEEDPKVKLLIIKGLGNPTFKDETQEELRLARADSVRACLQARGVVRPGGVERQKPL